MSQHLQGPTPQGLTHTLPQTLASGLPSAQELPPHCDCHQPLDMTSPSVKSLVQDPYKQQTPPPLPPPLICCRLRQAH